MAVLATKDTRLLIQGITGKEGLRAAEWAVAHHTKVLAGVTPGKGGQTVLDGIPVYNTVAEAVAAHPEINATSIYAPPRFVLDAAIEALDSGIPLLHIIAEEVPVKDSVLLLKKAQERGARVVGPASIGIISPGEAKIGSIGGPDNEAMRPGSVALVSKSGGLCGELSLLLTSSGYGQSTVVGIGGNVIEGTTYADMVPLLENDPQTKAIVIIGEIGGAYEEELAATLAKLPNHKPYFAYIGGLFAETLPAGLSFGHAGAIVDATIGTRQGKIDALKKAGVHIAVGPAELVPLLREHLKPDFAATVQ